MAGNAWAQHDSGLLLDGGFETLDGTWPAYEPSATSEPWATLNEGDNWKFAADTNRAHSGSQSVGFHAYWQQGSIIQALTNQVDSTKDYYLSTWMMIDELNTNSALINAPSVWASLSTSTNPAGPFTYRTGFFYATTNSTTNVWEQVGGVIEGSQLAAWDGEYIRVAVIKANSKTPYKIWIDDVALSTSDARLPATFYVDAVNGNDSNDGMTRTDPWQTPVAVWGFDNTQGFVPGDRILFRRGDTFTGGFRVQASGAEGLPIHIGAYGDESAAKPWLNGTWGKLLQLEFGNSYIEVSDLKFSNDQSASNSWNASAISIAVPEGSGEMKHIHITNCDFVNIRGNNGGSDGEDHQSYGIFAEIPGVQDTSPLSRWDDFRIENCYFEDIDGYGARVRDLCNSLSQVRRGFATNGLYMSTGLVYRNNLSTNLYSTHFQFNGQDGAIVENNLMDGTVTDSALWFWSCTDTAVRHNTVKNISKATADAYALHGDFMCINTLFEYNVGINCEGGLIQAINRSDGGVNIQSNLVARYNLGIDCGFRDNGNSAAIHLTGDVRDTKIYNNTIITTGSQPLFKAISFGNWTDDGTGWQSPGPYVGPDVWPKNSLIANNIFYAFGGVKPGYNNEAQMSLEGNVVSHNMYAGADAPDVCAAELNEVTGEPRFVNETGFAPEDFKVFYNSDAIGQGLVIADNGGMDYFGTALTNAVPSIGFYEFVSGGYTDTDGDLMSDEYEIANGLDPLVDDAHLDKDGDGRSNLEEFAADTFANDPSSYFVAQMLMASEELDWDARPGRIYRVFHALGLHEAWSLMHSDAVPPVSIDATETTGFYKVEVEYPIP
jgi:hypothetical protein